MKLLGGHCLLRAIPATQVQRRRSLAASPTFRRGVHHSLPATMSAGFPSAAERNRQLARRLKDAFAEAAASGTYVDIKRKAAGFRAGRLEAQELCRDFFSALGRTPESEGLYLEMAELLPTPQHYAALMDALRSMRSMESAAGQPPSQQAASAGGATSQQRDSVGSSAAEAALAPKPAGGSDSSGCTALGPSEQAAEQLSGRGGPEAYPLTAAGAGPSDAVLPGPLGAADNGGVHPNSLSARPAKRMRAPKGTRADVTGPATSSAPAQSIGMGEGALAPGAGVVVWLRQDLRLHDHPALTAAAADARGAGGMVTLVYVHSPQEDGDDPADGHSWRPGGASLLWVHGALASLDADLRGRYGDGAAIVYRRGPAVDALLEVAAAVGSSAVYFSRRYEPAMQATDARVQRELEAAGLRVRSFGGYLLREPGEVRLDMGKWSGHFGTLMPFYRACEALGPLPAPKPAPPTLPVADCSPAARCGGLPLEGLGLARMPVRRDGTVVDWGAPIRAAWPDMSEGAALALLERFIATGLARYERDRGFADGRCVSRLSPYLHFGQLSPRLMMQRLEQARCKQVSKTFWRRLVWRDLAYWQLHHWPCMAREPIRQHYVLQEWAHDPAALEAWRRGRTGLPLVDAGMRELWATGWMQQNARMAAACLLTEYLNIHWVEGLRWFHDTLVDADLAINAMMWSNAGKAGLDQWNFTVLPTSKAQDPDGSYIRRWVPELARLPPKHVHEPWKAPPAALAAAGVVLGTTYPHRITDRDWQELRGVNTAAIRAARAGAGPGCCDAGGYDLVTVPQGATVAHGGQRMRVFTKPEYRGSAGAASQADGVPKASSGAAPLRRAGGKAGGRKGQSAGQRTMLEYVARAAQ